MHSMHRARPAHRIPRTLAQTTQRQRLKRLLLVAVPEAGYAARAARPSRLALDGRDEEVRYGRADEHGGAEDHQNPPVPLCLVVVCAGAADVVVCG